FVVGATSFTGVDQTTPLNTTTTSSGTSSNPSITIVSVTNEMVFSAVVFQNSGTLNPGASQSQLFSLPTSANTLRGAGSVTTGAISTTMSWSQPGGVSSPWAMAALAIRPAPATD